MRGRMGSLMSIAALTLGMASMPSFHAAEIESDPEEIQRRKRAAERKASARERAQRPPIFRLSATPAPGSIAESNRRGGAHQHSREIERRMHQAERRAAKRPGG